jgi:hypothetical protein
MTRVGFGFAMVVMAVSLLDKGGWLAPAEPGGQHCDESGCTGSCQVTFARLVLPYTVAAAPGRQITAKAPSQ